MMAVLSSIDLDTSLSSLRIAFASIATYSHKTVIGARQIRSAGPSRNCFTSLDPVVIVERKYGFDSFKDFIRDWMLGWGRSSLLEGQFVGLGELVEAANAEE
jgi:hypothetical protein